MADGHSIQFRSIQGFPGYRVGDDGSVWLEWRNSCRGRQRTGHWRTMKQGINRKGYCTVNLTPPEGGRYQTFRVHRLVLTAFIGPCPAGMECRHINGIKTDNRLRNLVWGTAAENRQDNRRLNCYTQGQTHSQAKLTEDQVKAIRARYATGHIFQRELAADFGVSVAMISHIVNRKNWTHC